MVTSVPRQHNVHLKNAHKPKETLRLIGESHAIAVVRAAHFNAAIAWSPFELDERGQGSY